MYIHIQYCDHTSSSVAANFFKCTPLDCLFLASFPGLPCFCSSVCVQEQAKNREGLAGLIHHVNDVRWTQGGEGPDLTSRCQLWLNGTLGSKLKLFTTLPVTLQNHTPARCTQILNATLRYIDLTVSLHYMHAFQPCISADKCITQVHFHL